MAEKLFGGAVNALGAAAGVARHVAWYFSYQVTHRARDGS
jgi:hypothetical protein